MPSICSSWAEEVPILGEGKDWEDLPTDYFIFFLIEFVIKEVVRGGEETESELILDGGREQLN